MLQKVSAPGFLAGLVRPSWCRQFARRLVPCQSAPRFHGTHVEKTDPAKKLRIYFVNKHGKETPVDCWDGENVLEVAHENNVDVEGACEGSLACSTCHLIVDTDENYNTFKPPSVREEDLLDMAPGITERSRLGCQLWVQKGKHDEIRFTLPPNTRNFYVDGFVPKPH